MTWKRLVRVGGTVAAGVLVVAGSLAGGLYVASRLNDGDAASDQVVAVPEDPGVVHVHGLGVNPGDRKLYAATHTGLFVIEPGGSARRVGDGYHDTMAFTVVGPDRFLASGHPDLRDTRLRVDRKPPLLGLVESTDGGQTWNPRSLLGEADLHSIVARDDTIIAYDSTGGRVLASTDGGRSWETRASVTLRDLAVDPTDGDHVLGVTADGALVESRDQARSWSPFAQDGPSRITVLGWNSSAVWAGTEDGTLARFDSSAAAWETIRRVNGAVEALAVDEEHIHVAAEGAGIYRADAEGTGWRRLYTPPAQS